MQRLATTSHQKIPLALNKIAAGPAAEIGEDFTLLDLNLLITKGREGFVAFEVTGDSNHPDIQSGYIVFVDTWAEPRNGDYVASTVNGLTCIKKFSIAGRSLRLVSTNQKYPPREVTAADTFSVLGVVRGHLAVYY